MPCRNDTVSDVFSKLLKISKCLIFLKKLAKSSVFFGMNKFYLLLIK